MSESEFERMSRILNEGSGKYLLAYRTDHDDEVRKGLAVFEGKQEAEDKAAELVENLDVIVECWVESA